MRRTIAVGIAAVAGALALGSAEQVYTQATQPNARVAWRPAVSTSPQGEVEILPVQGKVYMLAGAGANITLHAGDQGMLLVDTGSGALNAKVIAAMKSISQRPLRYIINTTHQSDHTGGNAAIAATGEIIPFRDPNYTAGPQGALDIKKASVISYLTVFHRMALAKGPGALPESAWPDNTFSTDQKRFSFNDEPVVILHQTSTTDGNSLVHFRKSDVVSAGDLLDLTGYPRIEVEAGGSIQAMVEGLNRLIGIAVPLDNASGGTLVVPGHGRIADHAEVAYYRDMNTIVRDRVADMIKQKMTLAQVKAARPTRDWDGRYGKTTGAWTTDMYVEAVYRSLGK
jgi:glyoxylase-like metal-dependent hydrolase (beta-lactamase superfamily II)